MEILSSLLQKQIIIPIIAIVAGLFIGRMCIGPKGDSAQKGVLQRRLDSLDKEFAVIDLNIERLESNERVHKELLGKKNREIASNDSTYREKEKWFSRELTKLRSIPSEQVATLLDNRYENINEQDRDREILIDLVEGDSSAALLVIALDNIKLKDSNLAIMDLRINQKDSIITDLKRQIAIRNEETEIINARYDDLLKHDKKMKRQRNGLGVLAFISLLAAAIF